MSERINEWLEALLIGEIDFANAIILTIIVISIIIIIIIIIMTTLL